MASPLDSSVSLKPSPHDVVPLSSKTDVEPSEDNLEASSSIASSTEEAQLQGKPHSTNLHALLASLKIPDGIKDQPVNYVFVGKYQVGKSALINSKKAKGYQPIAEEGDLEPTTVVIKYYPCEVDGIKYDTMGLQDGTKKEKAHVKKSKIYSPKRT